MTAGEIFTKDCIKSVRLGFGGLPKMLSQLLDKVVNSDFRKYSAIKSEAVGIDELNSARSGCIRSNKMY